MIKKPLPYRWIVLAVACAAFFSPSYTQYQLSPLGPAICQGMGLSTSQFSAAFSSPMLPAVFFSLAIGLLADRLGIKRVVGVGLGISALGTALRVFAPSYPAFLSCMLLSGVGAACLNATGLKLFGGWFPPRQVDKMMGLLLSASTIGMAAAMATTALLPGVGAAYAVAAVISAAVWVLWLLMMKNPPAPPRAAGEGAAPPLGQCLGVVLRSRALWLAGGALLGIYGCEMLLGSFLPSALVGLGMGPAPAGAYSSAVTIGTFLGCLLIPFLAGRLGSPRRLLLPFGLIAAVGVAFGWRIPQGPLLGLALGLTGFVIGGMQPLLISIPVALGDIGPLYAGTAGGFMGTMQLLGAVVVPTCIAAPIAGSNMGVLFCIGGLFMVLALAMVAALYRLIQKNT